MAPATAMERSGATVGDLAILARLVTAEHPCLEVAARLDAEPELTSVVVQDRRGRLALLSRHRLQRELIGPNGYGRALYARRAIGDVPAGPVSLVLDSNTGIATAGEAMLGRDIESRYEDALVRWPDHQVGTVSLSAVMERLARAYEHQAMHDPLTDLANRALFVDRLEHALTRAERDATFLAVLFIDLDDFKGINDTHGHAAGDRALVVTAARLSSCLRSCDTAARLGGDEFAILLEALSGPGVAYDVGARLLEQLKGSVTIDNRAVAMNASLGIVVSSGDDAAAELLHRADVAMYKAKGGGKGRFEIFEVGMHAAVLERLTLKADLGRALDQGQLVAYYQPIFDLETGRIVGTEALVRWRHPDKGLLAPGHFISLAEESGMIVPLGLEVLRQAATETVRWERLSLGPPLRVSVNLSGRQVQDPGVARDVARTLEEAGLAPDRVTLEITESSLMADADGSVSVLAQLKELGLKLALDDFGTGYSSLSYLQRFPVDALKLDKSFVDPLGEDGWQKSALVRAIIGLGELFGLEVVAEGIEGAKQLACLRELGCRLGQGYYFARPMTTEDMEVFLKAHSPT